ncbi:hypothetical protein SPRG_17784 [Saprolegnia parasitica CBS 223.65]|uniref:Myb-like domain-containing protein n=1 Tax=Saprolegnia parasitica (strain CBS 223.65) TaxID=695850 RepID=A0A067BJ21_SAPPC|nr:hypothetical protein SPRG_17784 [Saprolegnia parasitica CBS 223.65]KDO16720.1 hypothetical protein SPRG_17784 [Saprolegnia parasitica CBS 223.65]|eukprot:XP_012212571.1 hypothetical protein SPRG_17784 [Saprolegnia parasitica CBS 223.65]
MASNKWTKKELVRLKSVQPSLTTWKKAAAAFPGHGPEDCRQKWLSEFSVPSKNKGAWSADEDDRLRIAMRETSKWLKVAEIVKTRCYRQCQSRWARMGKEDARSSATAPATTELPMDLFDFEDGDLSTMLHMTPLTEAENVEQHWTNWMQLPVSDYPDTSALDFAMDRTMVLAPVTMEPAQLWPLAPEFVEFQAPPSSADIAMNVAFWPDMSVSVQV